MSPASIFFAAHRLLVRGELVLGVLPRPPRPRALAEELDRLGSPVPRRGRPRWRGPPLGKRARRLASGASSCRFASPLRRPARSTSAAPAPHCTTGCSRAGQPAGRCSCASRTPTASVRPRRTSRRSTTRSMARSSTGTRSRFQTARGRAPPRGARAAAGRRAGLPLDGDRRERQGVQGPARGRSRLPRRGRGGGARSGCACRTRARPCPRRRDPRRRPTFQHAHLDDPVIARADGSVALQLRRRDRRPGRRHHRTSCAARTTSPTPRSSCSCWRRSARTPPIYAHLPLLHGPDGKKLSKRHGAASVQELRDAGYLPEAVRNYLALLGWGYDGRRDDLHHGRARGALQPRARVASPAACSTSRSCAG